MLHREFSLIKDSNLIENYNPSYSMNPANIFYILNNTDRYKNGIYYVLENEGEFVLSTGWNSYEYNPEIALVLTRTYVNPKYRGKLLMAKYVLPDILMKVKEFKHVYVTVNKFNTKLITSFEKLLKSKRQLNSNAKMYKNLVPKGIMNIYFTDQYVFEFIK